MESITPSYSYILVNFSGSASKFNYGNPGSWKLKGIDSKPQKWEKSQIRPTTM